MKPSELEAIRAELGLSNSGLARALGLDDSKHNAQRLVRRWTKGIVPITGPVAVALRLMLKLKRAGLWETEP